MAASLSNTSKLSSPQTSSTFSPVNNSKIENNLSEINKSEPLDTAKNLSEELEKCIPHVVYETNDESIRTVTPPGTELFTTNSSHAFSVTSKNVKSNQSARILRSRSKSPTKPSTRIHSRSLSTSASNSNSFSSISSPNSQSYSLFTNNPSVNNNLYKSAKPIVVNLRKCQSELVWNSPVHTMCFTGDVPALTLHLNDNPDEVNEQLSDGTTPLHCAVEAQQEACVRALLNGGASLACCRNDGVSPLHIAATNGHLGCLRQLLVKGMAVNSSTENNYSPLQLAVTHGHRECCQMLVERGANILSKGPDGLTAIHLAVLNNFPAILKLLLLKLKLEGTTQESNLAHRVVAITDSNGWSIAHMAASLQEKDCLVMLADSLPLDFDVRDSSGRSVSDVASQACLYLLSDIGGEISPVLKVQIELHYTLENRTVSTAQIGYIEVRPGMTWHAMESSLRGTLELYISRLDAGLRTKRISRLESSPDFSLGLSLSNVKQFEMGFYKWSPGSQTETLPYLILTNNEEHKIIIKVDDSSDMCELIAFDVLHPVSTISNYLRLLEQYKSTIFYGPVGCGKSYLSHRLAQSIAAREKSSGKRPAIYQLSLHQSFTSSQFLAFLKEKGCLLSADQEPEEFVPILLLDNLETVDLANLFGELLDHIENRGVLRSFILTDDQNIKGSYYLAENFYLIGTMNKSRSIGIDLSILPRFRWIQFKLDAEPLRGLLSRHFLRRLLNCHQGNLPELEDPLLRTVEWLICVWQRLNDSLAKLGLPELVIGPCLFFRCPLEKSSSATILDWFRNFWNQQISPRVRESVKRGTSPNSNTGGQQKVANTALYVLMQKSLVLGCPLSGPEKDAYFSEFCGSNELDIPLKQTNSGSNRLHASFLAPNISSNKTSQPVVNGKDLTDLNTGVKNNGKSSIGQDRKEEKRAVLFLSNIKRRSLSESSVNKATEVDSEETGPGKSRDSTTIPASQAKVAKLEVKSPKVVNISNVFKFNPSTSLSTNLPDSQQTSKGASTKKSGRISPLLSLFSPPSKRGTVSQSPKKSRSSENISDDHLYLANPKLRLSTPFSFSLATPTSKLNSFKFLDVDKKSFSNFSSEIPDFSVFNKDTEVPDNLFSPIDNSQTDLNNDTEII